MSCTYMSPCLLPTLFPALPNSSVFHCPCTSRSSTVLGIAPLEFSEIPICPLSRVLLEKSWYWCYHDWTRTHCFCTKYPRLYCTHTRVHSPSYLQVLCIVSQNAFTTTNTRFGSFEIFKTRDVTTGRIGPSVGRVDILHQLLDYVIKTFYPEVRQCSVCSLNNWTIFF